MFHRPYTTGRKMRRNPAAVLMRLALHDSVAIAECRTMPNEPNCVWPEILIMLTQVGALSCSAYCGRRSALGRSSGRSILSHSHLSGTNRGLFGTGHQNLREVFGALKATGHSGFRSIGVYRDQSVRDGTNSARCRHFTSTWNQTLSGFENQ